MHSLTRKYPYIHQYKLRLKRTYQNRQIRTSQNRLTKQYNGSRILLFDSMDSDSANNVDIGIQTAFPKMAPEDIENNDENTRFYTGFLNYATFMLFSTTFLKHGAAKLVYWEGQKEHLGVKGGNIMKNTSRNQGVK